MLTFREWWVSFDDSNRPVLRSTTWGEPWLSSLKSADKTPSVCNRHGIYAYTPWAKVGKTLYYPGDDVKVLGAVDAHGIIQIHEDGIVRSEHVKVLALRIVPPRKSFPHHHLGRRFNRIIYCDCNDKCESIRLQELEEALLRRYNVPRLPDGVGPWSAPFGARPA